MQLGVSEILEKASKIEDRNARILFLRQNGMKPVLTVLQYALDPNIKWLLPEGLPPFTRTELPGQETMLLAEARRMYLFVEGGHPNLTQSKREVLFVQFLEMLCSKDVDLIEACKNKTLPYPNLDYGVIKEAFPDLLPDNTFQDESKKETEDYIFPSRESTKGKGTLVTELPKPKKPKVKKETKEPKVKKPRGAKKAKVA